MINGSLAVLFTGVTAITTVYVNISDVTTVIMLSTASIVHSHHDGCASTISTDHKQHSRMYSKRCNVSVYTIELNISTTSSNCIHSDLTQLLALDYCFLNDVSVILCNYMVKLYKIPWSPLLQCAF
jgi:hypothetical protein